MTAIGKRAFKNCIELTEIDLPDSVQSVGGLCFYNAGITRLSIGSSLRDIGQYAFCYCHRLDSITAAEGSTAFRVIGGALYSADASELILYPAAGAASYAIPAGVTAIRAGAFSGAKNLTAVTIPATVTSIDPNAFDGCASLLSVTVPAGVTRIENETFFNCKALESVTLPAGITFIGEYAFFNCKVLESLTLPEGLTVIGNSAFRDCEALTCAAIPDSVTEIGEYAFESTGLTSVTLPAGLAGISDELFAYCADLRTVTIPDSVTAIGNEAFYGCESLRDILYTGSRAQWELISVGRYNDPLLAAALHCGITAVLTLPADLTAIESEAFAGLPNVDGIRIPAGVTDIAPDAFDSGVTLIVPAGSGWAQWAAENGYAACEE